MHLIIHLSKPIECTNTRANPNVNYGLWVSMLHEYRFISCNKSTSVVQDVHNEGNRHMGALYLLFNFAVNLSEVKSLSHV